MRRIISLLTGFVLLTFSSLAQNVRGTVKETDGKAIANASVSLLNAKDSSVIKLAVTDAAGQYEFKNIKNGRYITNVAYVGYAATYSPVFEVSGSDVNVAAVAVSKLNANLQNVTVTAKKPIIEVKA